MLREPEGPAGKGLRLCLSWCRPFRRGKNSAMSNLVKKHHTRQEKYTVMLFFPKEKQNVGIVWHCHQCQHLALVRLGCRNSLTRRLNHHSHRGSNGQQTGKASVAAAPAFPKASMHWRLAVWGSTAPKFPALGSGAFAHTNSQKASQKCPKHFNCFLETVL